MSGKIHPGHKSLLSEIKCQLKRFMAQLCKEGIQLTNRMVVQEASCLLPAFNDKSRNAKEVAVHCFKKSVGLTHRSAIHMAHKHFLETEADTKDIITMMKEKLEGRNPKDILNMDQTLIPYLYPLDVKGAKTIHARASMTDTKHVTLVMTITASGKMLPPFLIFKGNPNGCLASCKFSAYPMAGKYACQDKA
jgi:hypothetical protein